jgi:N-acetyl-anhydromuramyl-L-alanine amidase AmpD
MNIIQKVSPNFGQGRSGYKPEIIVLHIMDGSLVGTDNWFSNPISKVSSHYGAGFAGEIHQYVQDINTAWTQGYHEGATFKLHKPGVNPNLYCLSIEHEGHDLSIVHEAQIAASVELIKSLAAKWNIPIDRDHIIGHYEVDPIRKPNCPATNKSIIDTIVTRANLAQPIPVPTQPTTKGVLLKRIDELRAIVDTL